jgi:hypothetical protein
MPGMPYTPRRSEEPLILGLSACVIGLVHVILAISQKET